MHAGCVLYWHAHAMCTCKASGQIVQQQCGDATQGLICAAIRWCLAVCALLVLAVACFGTTHYATCGCQSRYSTPSTCCAKRCELLAVCCVTCVMQHVCAGRGHGAQGHRPLVTHALSGASTYPGAAEQPGWTLTHPAHVFMMCCMLCAVCCMLCVTHRVGPLTSQDHVGQVGTPFFCGSMRHSTVQANTTAYECT
jgi:hypothetical protein